MLKLWWDWMNLTVLFAILPFLFFWPERKAWVAPLIGDDIKPHMIWYKSLEHSELKKDGFWLDLYSLHFIFCFLFSSYTRIEIWSEGVFSPNICFSSEGVFLSSSHLKIFCRSDLLQLQLSFIIIIIRDISVQHLLQISKKMKSANGVPIQIMNAVLIYVVSYI